MRTLLENITFIKGVEYLIIVAFCFGFIALWTLVHKEKETTKKIVSIIIPLSLIFGSGAIVLNKYNDPDMIAGATPSDGNNFTNGNKSLDIKPEYFTVSYGSATEFHKIMSTKIDCSKCHHNSKEIQPCKNCHDKPFDTPNKPGLKAAYHQRCESCHQDKFNGPGSCISCHTGKPSEISAIPPPHHLTWTNCSRCHADGAEKEKQTNIVYHDNCLKCHTNSVAGATKIPADHEGRASNTCSGCHKPIE